uniref:Ribonuclease H-like domain-containing protein n=1 Tax=Tanacetum cinerariifolium TaxID=118510 RepID=A0A699HEM8_TANCI|nr:ribonuclease H-like domain-containing protein [Tanacetum cinerariifolium]
MDKLQEKFKAGLAKAPQKKSGSASEGTATKKGRTVAVTTEDMQKRRNDTFGGNEATKKTKKNLLKQQYGNFKVEGSETLEQTFNRLHVIRNKSDLDTMSLDDLYNHLKVYEPEVQKKSESNSQNMAFISLAKYNSGNGEVNTVSILTASTQVSSTGLNVATASISLDTACAYIASQSNGSQIKYEDINQIDEDDIEEMDIKWSALTATRWATFLGSVGHPEAKKEDWSFMANEEENHALVADEKAPTEFALMAKSSSDNKVCHKLRLDRKFSTGNTKFSTTDLGNKGKAVKASACWIWKPRQNSTNKVDTNVLLRTPRQHKMYSIDLNNIAPYKDLTCLVAKASADECMLWHRRLGHLNFKTMSRCDNGGEFRNKEMNDFCSRKGIKREFSNARTPQQNRVAERRNMTLIEVAARTMLACRAYHFHHIHDHRKSKEEDR